MPPHVISNPYAFVVFKWSPKRDLLDILHAALFYAILKTPKRTFKTSK